MLESASLSETDLSSFASDFEFNYDTKLDDDFSSNDFEFAKNNLSQFNHTQLDLSQVRRIQ